MKRGFAFFIAVLLVFGCTSCGDSEISEETTTLEATVAATENTSTPTTEVTTEAPTKATTEATTELTTEATTEATTELTTEVTTEATTEEITESEGDSGIIVVDEDTTLKLPDLPSSYTSYYYNSDVDKKWKITVTKIDCNVSGNKVHVKVTAKMETKYDDNDYGDIVYKLIGPNSDDGYNYWDYRSRFFGTQRCEEGDVVTDEHDLELPDAGEYKLVFEDSHGY